MNPLKPLQSHQHLGDNIPEDAHGDPGGVLLPRAVGGSHLTAVGLAVALEGLTKT